MKAHFLSNLHHSDVKHDVVSHNGAKKERKKIKRNFRNDNLGRFFLLFAFFSLCTNINGENGEQIVGENLNSFILVISLETHVVSNSVQS